MIVFKFGGASIKNATAAKNVLKILDNYKHNDLFVVISAIGKTTNMLEQLINKLEGTRDCLLKQYNEIKDFHLAVLEELLPGNQKALQHLMDLFSELLSELDKTPEDNYDRTYDRIICYGELFSTSIIVHYFESRQFPVKYLAAQQLIITDETWREARVNWEETIMRIRENVESHKEQIFITEGFIGSSVNGHPVSLGREGSDFTAAIVAFALDAEEVMIWKDVPGLMNADPKIFPEAEKLDVISYHETIELAYYGAKVIHPKTIKPLQNKKIPLRVKSFVNPADEGSLIQSLNAYDQIIPSFIVKNNQILISVATKDFTFIMEDHLSFIFSLMSQNNIRANLMQNSAISFSVCVDDKGSKTNRFIELLAATFDLKFNANLDLITIRHFNDEAISRLLKDKNVIVEQRSRNTAQFVVKSQS
ncbi:MAG: aspartate kinase [Bacteroidales bacterium]|nr:aspartate kinase [Bacteroidales bacterium]